MTDEPYTAPKSCQHRADEPEPRAGQNPSVHAATRGFWRGFGTALLEALHESRSRQAAREIEYHQHLIDEARAFRARQAIGPTRSNASGNQRRRASLGTGGPWPLANLPIKMTIVVALLVIFGVLHVVGGVLLAHSVRSPGDARTLQLSGD